MCVYVVLDYTFTPWCNPGVWCSRCIILDYDNSDPPVSPMALMSTILWSVFTAKEVEPLPADHQALVHLLKKLGHRRPVLCLMAPVVVSEQLTAFSCSLDLVLAGWVPACGGSWEVT